MLATLYAHLEAGIQNISGFIWGGEWNGAQVLPVGPIAVVLLGTGLFFMLRLGGRPLLRFIPALVEVWKGRKGNGDPSAITPFQALSTALSGQVGTGNIVGVATALTLGGPGAIFWMWVTAIFGMALAFAESSLAIKYREIDENGRINGGPMYYIKKGLGKNWTWLAAIFCVGTLLSATATGGMIQANSLTANIHSAFSDGGIGIPLWLLGIVLAGLVFAVIVGGIKSIGRVAGSLVPAMAALYILACLIILLLNIQYIPGAFGMIFSSAFGLNQAAGGLAGYAVLSAIRFGVARGLFSNEAGQGSAPIAHAASQMKNPAKQGEIAMIGVFIDTMVLCTMTALVILTAEGSWATAEQFKQWAGETTTHVWMAEGSNPATLTNQAFTDAVPGPVGGWLVTLCLTLFAFTTIIGWSYYAEQAVTFLVGEWATKPFRYIWVVIIFIGAMAEVNIVWLFGDIANASMAFPNLIAILLLSGVVYGIHKSNGDPDTADGDSILEDLRIKETPAE
ncbi:amino acid carrier protein [Hyphomonas neptunium ATCC 15444]|uniref:Amino acid carrier protein n=2 Tax=Hyphomonas TaxID=85 RepID=Q0C608_HYPNA|nr:MULTISPECIES: sodium:alanine symporter family protein [Hyphomonas]ABI77075.1 amino acid carrier protein [Hyphomonas neptunium ATCC 15444]KCZ94914.1 amino acid carrier protein [Hyphomonas hirschiana VP5]